MKIGAINHPARNLLEEIDWFGRHDFDFIDLLAKGLKGRERAAQRFELCERFPPIFLGR